MRDDFLAATKDLLAKRVSYRCSNPGCRQSTSGPQDDPKKSINVGVAAHMTAASLGGPRYNPNLTPDQRCSHENGIWLCQTCAKPIDNDEVFYGIERLRNWKRGAENAAKRALEERTASKSKDRPALGVDDSSLEFVETTGVYFDRALKLHVCPRCKADNKRSYLKNEESGFRCTVCGQYFSDPARQREPRTEYYSPFPSGPNGWMAR